MNLRKGQVLDLKIESIAFGGKGVGRHDGLTVFVDKTMPGDEVKASLSRIKSNFCEADLVEIVKKSAERVEPECKHFGICGGCNFQFMPYEKQLEMKRQHVVDAFERIGGFDDVVVNDVIGCENTFYYRNKLEFSFGYDKDMNFAFGYHMPGRKFDKINIDECLLESPLSNKILAAVRDFAMEGKFVPFKFSDGTGFLRSLFVREGKRTGEVMVNLNTGCDIPDGFEEALERLGDELLALGVSSFYWTKIISKRGAKRRIEETLVRGKKFLSEKLVLAGEVELEFDILPQAFFQVNTYQAEVLYNEVIKLVKGFDTSNVFDLFCGTGTIGIFIAKFAEKVLGVEINEDAVKSARENAKKNQINNIDFYVGDVGKLLEEIEEKPSLIVVDPPRAGLTRKMIELIEGFGSKGVIYVSCNPATLARDCAIFDELGFTVKSIQPVDMFPHSYHIENVCLLERSS